MNDSRQDDEGARVFAPWMGFVTGAVMGAVVGGGLALLLAPASGERTRRRIGSTAKRWTNDAREALAEGRETVTEAAGELREDVQSAIDAGRAAFEHDGAPRGVSRIAQMLDPSRKRNT